MKILHFGDIHFWKIGTDVDCLYPKRFLGSINLTIRRRHKFPPAYAPAVAAEVARLGAAGEADLAIFSGDFTTMSLVPEYQMAAEAFRPIVDAFGGGSRLFAIPGNHDRYTPRSVRSGRFEEYLPYAGLPDGQLVKTQHLESNLSLVGFDCSHPCKVRSNGTMTDPLVTELRETLEVEQAAGRRVFLVGHYPYAYREGIEGTWEHRLLRSERLAELVAEFAPIAYFHGHKHIRWAIRPPETPNTLCLNCGASGMKSSSSDKQAGFLIAEFDGNADLSPKAVTAHVLSEDGASFRVEDVAI